MYMFPHKCMVTGATSTRAVAPAKAPVWCEDNQSNCVQGPKQMIFWNQLDGNNVVTTGYQLEGNEKSPAYNMKLGFRDGKSCVSMVRNHRLNTIFRLSLIHI